MPIKLVVTQERYGKILDLDDSCNLDEVTVKRAYDYLLEFVVDDDGNYIGAQAARKLFQKEHVKREEIGEYWTQFIKKVSEAFVPPPSGAA